MMGIREALELFLALTQAEDAAHATIKSYQDHIGAFVKWLPSNRLVSEIATNDLVQFINHERKRGLSKHTIYGRYRSLFRFFEWCEQNEVVGFPPSPFKNSRGRHIFKVKKPPKQIPRRAHIEVIDALIDSIPRGHWIQLRNRALLRLLRDTGIRIGEAANVKVADLDLLGRVLTIPESKSRRPRDVRLHKATVEAIQAYLLCRPVVSPKTAAYLFIGAVNDNPENGSTDKPWSSDAMRRTIAKLCERANLPHINPHSIRHLFGTKALNDGIRLEVVSELMGHHDPSFTRKMYADLLPETARQEYDEHWQ